MWPRCSAPGVNSATARLRAIFTKLNLPAAADDHRRHLAVLAFLLRDHDE
jgi:hypothetical protein